MMGAPGLAFETWHPRDRIPMEKPPTGPCTGNRVRVPHISLVFREMWDTTTLDVQLCRPSSRYI